MKYLFILFAFVLAGCGKVDCILYTADALDGSPIAVLDNAVSEDNLEEIRHNPLQILIGVPACDRHRKM